MTITGKSHGCHFKKKYPTWQQDFKSRTIAQNSDAIVKHDFSALISAIGPRPFPCTRRNKIKIPTDLNKSWIFIKSRGTNILSCEFFFLSFFLSFFLPFFLSDSHLNIFPLSQKTSHTCKTHEKLAYSCSILSYQTSIRCLQKVVARKYFYNIIGPAFLLFLTISSFLKQVTLPQQPHKNHSL